jgi:hypothetical protein
MKQLKIIENKYDLDIKECRTQKRLPFRSCLVVDSWLRESNDPCPCACEVVQSPGEHSPAESKEYKEPQVEGSQRTNR